ncbi:hypothetical protein J31TS4_15920 [Paenibacillus sp. J31TS4]|uniref:Rho termination factor N-terminal domain-containing protein n=1 Tax=Paenibacillus sp. J31TS4 TaxID=2807195 RepID=UPI001B0E7CF7|nr:Rho termination factor N-terminal domain-containing protein [Paenibacillus sp. J31TS4]GIP38312.1 hypothetical protein J31TS4_15920 [Paenibacillus sp. J31TS4]
MAEVVKAFRDKFTKMLYDVGDVYEGDRAEELAKLGYVAEAADKPLEDMTKAELLKYAEENEIDGVTSAMNKAEILEAIKAVQ